MTATAVMLEVLPGEVLTREQVEEMLVNVSAGVVGGVVGVLDQFAEHRVLLRLDEVGGVHVVIDDIVPGETYVGSTTWFGFHISAAYPAADVYPHYVGRLHRKDAAAHPEGFSECEWQEREALQLSRRSNRWNPATDTAALKAMKVLAWLASR